MPDSSAPTERLHISGVVVRVDPGGLAQTLPALRSLPGVQVHLHDEESGKIVVTVEAADVEGLERGVRRIRALSAVRLAEPVYHWVGDDPDAGANAALIQITDPGDAPVRSDPAGASDSGDGR